VTRFGTWIALLGLMVACQNETHPVFTPAPSPSPHLAPTAAVLQPTEVPAGLNVCQGSGPVDVFLSVLATKDATVASRLDGYWAELVTGGATSGAMAVYASGTPGCTAELGATANLKTVMSFVARFPDASQADRAWHAGVFGFAPPPAGQLTPGLTLGTSTGLGASSFTYDRPSVRLACWRHGFYVAMIVAGNLDLNTFRAATAAVDARLN
jgi:hypothetical protein